MSDIKTTEELLSNTRKKLTEKLELFFVTYVN